MKNEGHVKKAVRKILDTTPGCYHFMPPANGYGRSGIPDIIGCVNGRFFGIETKFGTNKPTALQEREIQMIREANSIAWVVSDRNIAEWEVSFKQWADNVSS
jgi:Holliday junction resolvase